MDSNIENAIELEDVTKIFRDFWHRPKVKAVDGIDLCVRRGEIFGLLGPNGSGKSTTIKMILGLLKPSAGLISVMGRNPDNVSAKAKIGYLPGETYLHGHLTAKETLDFYACLFSISPATRDRRISQLLEMVDLMQAADRQVGEFSKGMARRIGLAQSLINDPELLILDEPTSGLDPIACRQTKDILKTLAKRGKTVLVTSHLLADMEDVCDRVAIMFNGRIIAIGPVNELLSRKDLSRVTFPTLAKDNIDRLAALIKELTGSSAVIDSPSIDLERFFIDEVKKADAESGKQTKTHDIADYLALD